MWPTLSNFEPGFKLKVSLKPMLVFSISVLIWNVCFSPTDLTYNVGWQTGWDAVPSTEQRRWSLKLHHRLGLLVNNATKIMGYICLTTLAFCWDKLRLIGTTANSSLKLYYFVLNVLIAKPFLINICLL